MRYRYRSDGEIKDSGIEWVEGIPRGWVIAKISTVITELTDYVANGSFESLAKNVKYLSEENYAILIRTQDNSNGFKGPFVYIDEKAYEFLSKSKVYNGDIIISNVGAVGNVFRAPNLRKPMSLAPNSILLRTTQHNQFLYYLLQSDFSQQEIRTIVSSTAQPKFNKTNFRTIRTIIPPLEEQKKISNFLDEKTAQFDSIISKKEALIQKLEEAKKSLISEVVTGKVKVLKTEDGFELVERKEEEMKDSGVKWIGKIPKCWEVVPLYTNFIENKLKNKLESETNLLSLSYGNIIRKDINSNLGLLPENFSTYQIVNKGDIIFRLTDLQNDKKSLRVGLVGEKGIITSAYTCIKLLSGEDKYYYYLFHYYDIKKLYYNLGAGVRQSMSFSDLKKVPILIPDYEDQGEIVRALDKRLNNINIIIERTKQLIKKVKEAKQSLITESVTGKIEILD